MTHLTLVYLSPTNHCLVFLFKFLFGTVFFPHTFFPLSPLGRFVLQTEIEGNFVLKNIVLSTVSFHFSHFCCLDQCAVYILYSKIPTDPGLLKHGAILYNKAEVFSLSITNPNGPPMLPFDWLIHSSLILVSCHRILFFCRFSAVEK